MTLLDERLLRIVGLRELGRDANYICRALNLSQEEMLRCEEGTKLMIKQEISEGVDNIIDLSKKTKINKFVLELFMNCYEINIAELLKKRAEVDSKNSFFQLPPGKPKKRRISKKEELIQSIERAMQDPPSTFKELLEKVDSTGPKTMRLCQTYHIPLNMQLGWRLEIDVGIRAGGSLEEIAQGARKITGIKISRERVRQYVRESGQYLLREQRKAEREIKERAIRLSPISLLDQRIDNLAKKEGWAYQKAVECRKNYRYINPTTFEKVVEFFQRKKEDKTKSLEKQCQGLFCYNTGMRILKAVGEPLYESRNKSTPQETQQNKEKIYRAVRAGFNGADIAYFMGMGHQNVLRYIARTGISLPRLNMVKTFYRSNKRGIECTLSYRLASQVYEEIDKGDLTPAEIAFCLDMPARMMVYTLENRKDGKNIEEGIARLKKIVS